MSEKPRLCNLGDAVGVYVDGRRRPHVWPSDEACAILLGHEAMLTVLRDVLTLYDAVTDGGKHPLTPLVLAAPLVARLRAAAKAKE
jgi:hypothetical protein